MKIWGLGALLLGALLVLPGCSHTFEYTGISTKNLNYKVPRTAQRSVAKSCVPILIFPLGYPSIAKAADRAIEKAGPQYNALVDGVVNYKWGGFIIGAACFEVEGTPVIADQVFARRPGGDTLYHSRRATPNRDHSANPANPADRANRADPTHMPSPVTGG